ncbi:MAG TPA: prepilin-type N-terminal cleavage/methylation domain-containing protein [Gemmatimonadales bacterium]
MAPAQGAPRGLRRGLTLIELMIAVLIINVALLALAGLGATVSRQLRQGAVQTRAAMMVQSRLDSLASLQPCNSIVSATNPTRTGTATRNGITEKWVIRDDKNVIHVIDTVTIPGRTQPLVYQSLIQCRD